MNLRRISISLGASLLFITAAALTAHAQAKYTRDPNQPTDEEYTRKIAEYTTEKFFNSPLTDYLPTSPNVPTPESGPWRCRWCAGKIAVLRRDLSLHAHARESEPAGEGVFDRHDRRRPRDDRRGDRL